MVGSRRVIAAAVTSAIIESSIFAVTKTIFRVRRDSTKKEIRGAVEMLFEVKVTDVQVVNCRGKIKRFGQDWGQRNAWKKAYVTLAEGENIDFLGAES